MARHTHSTDTRRIARLGIGIIVGSIVIAPPRSAPAQNCPFAHTTSAIPQAGTVDARQPHEPGVPDVIQGIGGAGEPIVIALDPLFPSAPASADIACWT
ncbi:MAG: hypothetical protein ACE5E6_09885, partial [Phycisphaerae bacterium]